MLCGTSRSPVDASRLHGLSTQAPLYTHLRALWHSRRAQVVTEQVATDQNDSSSGADAQTGFSAHWLALLRAVPDVAESRARASTEQANECEVLLDVHESDLLRATRPGSGYPVSPPLPHEQDMQVPKLLCVAALVNVWLAECAVADAARDICSDSA